MNTQHDFSCNLHFKKEIQEMQQRIPPSILLQNVAFVRVFVCNRTQVQNEREIVTERMTIPLILISPQGLET